MPTNVDHTTEEEPSGQPAFVGRVGLVMMILAILFAILVIVAGLTHQAYIV